MFKKGFRKGFNEWIAGKYFKLFLVIHWKWSMFWKTFDKQTNRKWWIYVSGNARKSVTDRARIGKSRDSTDCWPEIIQPFWISQMLIIHSSYSVCGWTKYYIKQVYLRSIAKKRGKGFDNAITRGSSWFRLPCIMSTRVRLDQKWYIFVTCELALFTPHFPVVVEFKNVYTVLGGETFPRLQPLAHKPNITGLLLFYC